MINKLLKKNKSWIVATTVFFSIALLTSAANFKAQNPQAGFAPNSIFDQKKSLVITSKAFDKEESVRYLNKNLLERGIQPVEITLENNTSHSYSISSSSVDLPSMSGSHISSKLSKSEIARSVGLKTASLVFWPFNFPSIIDTLKGIKSKANLKRDLNAKSLKSSEIVLPFSSVSRMIYVPMSQFRSSYHLKLIDLYKEEPVVIEVATPANGEKKAPPQTVQHDESRLDRALKN